MGLAKGVSEVTSSVLLDFASVISSVVASGAVLGEALLVSVDSVVEHLDVNCGT